MNAKVVIFLILTSSFILDAKAGSADWNLNPTSADWNTAVNWTPATVPNGPADTATFASSAVTDVSISARVQVNGIAFDPGAEAFTINNQPGVVLTLSGAGITNSSGVLQNFANSSELHFTHGATAGDSVVYTNPQATLIKFEDSSTASSAQFINFAGDASSFAGQIVFQGHSTAGNGTFRNTGLPDAGHHPEVTFRDQASAGQAVFTNDPFSGGIVSFYNHATADHAIITTAEIFSIAWFFSNSTAGNATLVNEGSTIVAGYGGTTQFIDSSTAGNSLCIANGAAVASIQSEEGKVSFGDNATAANGTFIANGGQVPGANGAFILLYNSSTAENGTFYANGAPADGAFGGAVIFGLDATASAATLIAKGEIGSGGDEPGGIVFADNSVGAQARVELFENGFLDIRGHDTPELTIGSLEGDGLVFMGGANLSVGSNNLSTIFSGLIEEASEGTTGSLTKIGTGMLKLSGPNTYTGGTTVNRGGLVINNTTGSGTGTGAVQVNGGTLAGSGIISGAVTVGTGSGTGAFLTPGMGASKATTLTIQSALTFEADGTYTCRLNTKKAKADQLIANEITIESGAQFAFKATGGEQLQTGKSATVISNTAATPISGTFANLPDGSTFTVGPNTFEVSYEGGDGNDLTLTVVP